MKAFGVPQDPLWKERLRRGLSDTERVSFAEFALSKVSRTFALNIRVLPSALQTHVLYAYLFCRMADTLEDDPILAPEEKIRQLQRFASLFKTSQPDNLNAAKQAMHEFAERVPQTWKTSEDWEHLLLVHAPEVLLPFLDFPEPVQTILSRCITEMCAGMESFIAKQTRNGGLNLIETLEDLDRYCYYVAGTVGILLCELFIHNSHIPQKRAEQLRERCVSFGLGLQLTNILKDLQDDKDRNISWLPGELLKSEALTLHDFLHSPAAKSGRQKIYRILFSKTQKHLEDALEYSRLIPRQNRQLRLFCLWPLFMAAETLALLAERLDDLTQGVRLKIPRTAVKRIILQTQLLWWSNTWIDHEFRKSIQRLEKALNPSSANSSAKSFTLEPS